MTRLRAIFVFCFYLAAGLMSPMVATSIESMEGEAQESVQLAGQRRHVRVVDERRFSMTAEVVASTRPAAPRSAPTIPRTHGNLVRKVPSPASESPPAPEDQ